jgi:hypothetical protein
VDSPLLVAMTLDHLAKFEIDVRKFKRKAKEK